MNRQEPETVAEMTARLDRAAVEADFVDNDPVRTEVFADLDGDEAAGDLTPTTEGLAAIVRRLFEMRLLDADGFDVFALKTLRPDMTQDDIAAWLRATARANWQSRSACCEAVRRLIARYPELGDVVHFDKRGGNRARRATIGRLVAEYVALRKAEDAKPPQQKRKLTGDGGVYATLAVAFAIRNRAGKPDWRIVKNRIYRAAKRQIIDMEGYEPTANRRKKGAQNGR